MNGSHKTCTQHRLDGSIRASAGARGGSRRRKNSAALQSITPEEWVRLWEAQGGLCCLCHHTLHNRYSGVERDKKKDRLAAVDHDHQVEKTEGTKASIRGLLCAYPCNRRLVRELTAEWLERAAAYVRELPAQAILNPSR